MIRFLQTEGKTKKIVIGTLLTLICVAMVITLIPGGIGSSMGLGGAASLAKGVVATVGGEPITAQEINNQARGMLRQQFPRGNPMAEQMLPYFSQQAYQNLVSQKALVVAAQNMGLKVSDEELRDEFEHGQYSQTFFPNGKFIGEKEYEDLLSQANLTVAKFQEMEKSGIMLRKLQALVAGSAVVTNAEVNEEFRKRNTKVKFDYAIVNADEIRKGIHPGDEELKAYYEKNKAAYVNSIPEKRKLRYALVDVAKVQASVQVSNEDLKSYYLQNGNQYRVPEQVSVRHIIIKAPAPGADGKVDPKALDAARAKADDVLKQIKAGGDFGQLAQKYSEDPSSNVGGMLGWLKRGGYPSPEVEKVIFSLPKGQTSDVLKSGYGFHIVRAEDKQDAHLKPLDEVKGEIEPILKQQAALRQAEAKANSLLTQARANGIEKAAQGDAVTTDFVSSGDTLPGIGVAPELMTAVFAAKEKAPPELLHTPQGYAVYEVVGIQPPSTPTYGEIRAKLEDQFKNERGNELLTKKTQELADRAKTSHDLKKIAHDLGATIKTSDAVLPTAQVPDIGAMSNEQLAGLFTGKDGDIVGPVQAGQNGAVLQLVSREAPSAADLVAKKDEIREGLLQQKRNEMFGMYVTNLRQLMEKSGKIVVNQNELKALTGGRGPTGL